MRNNVKLLLASIAGILVFSNQGYSMNPDLLGALNKKGSGAGQAAAVGQATAISPAEDLKNRFFRESATLASALTANMLKEQPGELKFDPEECSLAHSAIKDYVDANVPPDLQEEVSLLIYRQLLSKMGGKVMNFSVAAFNELGNTSKLSPQEKDRKKAERALRQNQQRAGESANLQIGASSMAEIKKKAEERQRRRRTAGVEESFATTPSSPHQANSLPYQANLKLTQKEVDRYSTSSTESLGTPSGLSSAHSSFSNISNSSSASTSPELITPTKNTFAPQKYVIPEITNDDIF